MKLFFSILLVLTYALATCLQSPKRAQWPANSKRPSRYRRKHEGSAKTTGNPTLLKSCPTLNGLSQQMVQLSSYSASSSQTQNPRSIVTDSRPSDSKPLFRHPKTLSGPIFQKPAQKRSQNAQKNGSKSKNQKSVTTDQRSQVQEATHQVWTQLDHLPAQKIKFRSKLDNSLKA